jgi:hypothetical protein
MRACVVDISLLTFLGQLWVVEGLVEGGAIATPLGVDRRPMGLRFHGALVWLSCVGQAHVEWGLFAIVFLRCGREEAPDRDRQKAIRDALLDLRFVSQVHGPREHTYISLRISFTEEG